MRKVLALLLAFITLVSISSFVYAGEIEECEKFKKTSDYFRPEYKGLYGLCVAYQNADEEGKEDIFRNWQKKVGDDGEPQLPGHLYSESACPEEQDFCCPCWSAFSVADICSMGDPNSFPGEPVLVEFDDGVEVTLWNLDDSVVNNLSVFGLVEPRACEYYYQPFTLIGNDLSFGTSVTISADLSENLAQNCRDEIEIIAELFENDVCASVTD